MNGTKRRVAQIPISGYWVAYDDNGTKLGDYETEWAAKLAAGLIKPPTRSVVQDWVQELSMMQQTVVLEVIRGPDTIAKYHPSKFLLRWYRRCVLLSSFDQAVIETPYASGGGSFTGPSINAGGQPYYSIGPITGNEWYDGMNNLVSEYLRGVDEIPHHFHLHFMHAIEILGYKHPQEHKRNWWLQVYLRFVKDMHLRPETMTQLDERLGDSRDGWLKHADEATTA